MNARDKIVCQVQIVVNENATELPKYSKSLHFCWSDAVPNQFYWSEQEANVEPANGRSIMGFTFGVAAVSVLYEGLLSFLPEIWPLGCS